MKRRDAVLVPLALGAATLARTQVPGRTYRVGFLGFTATNTPSDQRIWDGFVQRLHELGRKLGGNLVIEDRYAEGRNERNAEFAVEMVKLKVDVVVVTSGAAARAVMAASPTMPIVGIFLPDPVRAGLVASMGRPGGQLTGIYHLGPELTLKHLDLLKAAVPAATRVAFMGCPRCELDAGLSAAELAAILNERTAAARSIGLTFLPFDVNAPSDFDSAGAAMLRARADALLIGPTSVNHLLRAKWLAFAQQHRLPTIAGGTGWGAMLSYAADPAGHFAKAVEYVSKVLGGASPGEIPMEQPTTFQFVVNLKMAKAMGLTIPQSVLLRADEVIQ